MNEDGYKEDEWIRNPIKFLLTCPHCKKDLNIDLSKGYKLYVTK